jgi:nitric oxide reductase large subunit
MKRIQIGDNVVVTVLEIHGNKVRIGISAPGTHGSYVAPDWTADYLHREAVFILDRWPEDEFGSPFE